jgi:hypothetical protein
MGLLGLQLFAMAVWPESQRCLPRWRLRLAANLLAPVILLAQDIGGSGDCRRHVCPPLTPPR